MQEATIYSQYLIKIADLQNQVNILTNGEDWIQKHRNWNRAIIDEVAEFYNQIGYKWWKKQDPKLEQAKLELIDILHFLVSKIIEESIYEKVIESSYYCRSYRNDTDITALDQAKVSMDLVDKCLVQVLAGNKTIALAHLMDALTVLGAPTKDVFVAYVCKNVLNIFRQHHGYKDGTYKKIWNGKEDNEVLEEYYSKIPADFDPLQLFTTLYNFLVDEYKKVK